MEKTVFIINPQSRNKKSLSIWAKTEKQAYKIFPQAEIYITKEKGDGEKKVASLIKEHTKIHVVVVGGDGTVNEIVNGIMVDEGLFADRVSLSLLPLGTGSDLSRSFSINKDPKKALEEIKNSSERKLDIWCVETLENEIKKNRYFANMCSLGLSGHVAQIANKSSKILGGQLSYLIATLRGFVSYQPQEVIIKSKTEILYEGKISLALFANGRYCGGGMLMSPDSQTDDQLLDVIIVENISKMELGMHFPKIYKGKHIPHPHIKLFKANNVEISTNSTFIPIEMDGETPLGIPHKIRFGKTISMR